MEVLYWDGLNLPQINKFCKLFDFYTKLYMIYLAILSRMGTEIPMMWISAQMWS